MALGSSSFGTILQSNSELHATNINPEAIKAIASNNIPVETAGSIAWGGFDICDLSSTTEVDYTAYTSAPVETAGSIASAAPIGSFASNAVSSSGVSVASVSTTVSAPSCSNCSCSYSC